MHLLARRIWPALTLSLVACLLLIGPAMAQEKSVYPGINKPYENPSIKDSIERFEKENREVFAQRQKIVAACKLKPGMAVADIGAGTGLFTRLFAAEVGPQGRVYAVDIAKKFIEHVEKTAQEAGLKNVTGIVCTATSAELPPGSVDLVFLSDTYHHFEFPQKTMASIHQALRPGGQLVLVDYCRIAGKTPDWLMKHLRAGQEVVVKEIEAAGFKVVECPQFLKENYFVRFEKTARSAATAQDASRAETAATGPVGVVSHVKVLSDKVRDVSSIEAWKTSFIRDTMTDQEKAVAVWRSVAMHRYQDPPPIEFLHEGCVHDPIKTFNVYGYGMCCCASSNIETLARYVGLEARGQSINFHSVPEVFYDNAWHMFDASLVNYFPKPDGKIASVEEIVAAVKGWLEKNPEYRRNDGKLRQFHQAAGWTGWKRGPELLNNCPFYDWSGWWPAKTHGWYSTMQEFDGSGKTPFVYEYGYSQGYEVNIQLRPGERLVRNWFNNGLHVNGIQNDGGAPGCLKQKVGEGSMAYARRDFNDLTSGRVGSGTLEYDVPLADGTFRTGAWKVENLAAKSDDNAGPAMHVKEAAQPGVLEIRMPSSYVYLTGEVNLDAAIGSGGKIQLLLSDNNGLDWKEVASIGQPGPQRIDVQKFVLRRYDYRLRLVLSGKGTGLERLKIAHAIQCSQRALPTLAKDENTITFSAGPQEGTVTIEGTSYNNTKGKNVSLADFRPTLKNVNPQMFRVEGDPAEVTIPISTPGEMTRLRFGGHFRARDKRDQWKMQVSFDGGKTFKTVDTCVGPTQGKCKYATVSDIPPDTTEAQIRWSGKQRNTACLFSARIDADYKQPCGGFRPVKVTYTWSEDGVEKQDVHVSASPRESYKIVCGAAPEMKSISLELSR